MQNLTDEIKDLLLTRSLLLQRVSNSLTKDIINAYVSVIDDILAQIATGKNINLVNMNKIINELNAKLTPNLTSVNDDLVQLGISEASYVANGINGAIGIDLVSKLPTDRTVQKIVNTSLMDGLTLSSWLEDKDNKLKMLLKDNIQQGVIQGETIPQIVSRLKGVLTINKEGVKALAITAVATVTNQVRMQTYKENEDIFKGYEHNSTLDKSTTLICSSRDGAFWDLNGKGLNAKGKQFKFMITPLHFRCRSLILPIVKSFKELGIPLDEVPIGTRSSMDGYVSRDTTFEKWFEGKSKSFQEEYLGKGRYELYKKGTITFSDLVNQNGRTLKISELTKINPIAKVSNIPTIDFGYGGKFNKYVENIRDEAKIVIDKLPKPKEIIDVDNIGSYYSTGIIANGKATNTNATFLHEYGHFIDETLGKNNIYKSSENNFKDALVKDAFTHLDNNGTFKNNNLIRFVEDLHETRLVNGKYRTARVKNENNGMIADIADAMSGGRVSELEALYSKKIYAGHGIDYYGGKILHRSRTETFANMFSVWSQNDLESIENIKKIAPNTYKEFENIINNIVQSK